MRLTARVCRFVFLMPLWALGCATSAGTAPVGAATSPPPLERCGPVSDVYRRGLEASWRAPATVPVANATLRPKDAHGRILVVKLNRHAALDPHAGEQVAIEKELWVTLAPDLQRACSGFSPAERKTRLHQLLGLPLERNYDRVTTYWVDRDALFRPCEDEEIDDTRCNAPSDAWRAARAKDGHCDPFTGVGYTWDWGRAAPGLSEFQLRTTAQMQAQGASDLAARPLLNCVFHDVDAFCDAARTMGTCPHDATRETVGQTRRNFP